MGELTPIDVDSLTPEEGIKAVLRGVVQTHGCLEQHITEQTKFNATMQLAHIEATSKRQELTESLLDVRGEVLEISRALGVRKPDDGQAKPKARVTISWTERLKLVGTIGGSIVGIAALYKFGLAIWPAVDVYLRSLS